MKLVDGDLVSDLRSVMSTPHGWNRNSNPKALSLTSKCMTFSDAGGADREARCPR